jgi:hypothetical protein
MKQFYFDTADGPAVRSLWQRMSQDVDPQQVRGITTNPRIYSKSDKYSLQSWLDTVEEMAGFLEEIRGDREGEVHIQFPTSKATVQEYVDFAYLLRDKFSKLCRVGVKIPPRTDILKSLGRFPWELKINVTGCSEAGTILKAGNYGVDYCSLIFGRIYEIEENAEGQAAYVAANKDCNFEQILGAMRTPIQLINSFRYGIPTVGLAVWEKVIEVDLLDSVMEVDWSEVSAPDLAPTISQKLTNLSLAFFDQMDQEGNQAYEDFKKLPKVEPVNNDLRIPMFFE